MEVGSTRRHARDKFYQAPPLFSCNVEKIREPGDKATYGVLFVLVVFVVSVDSYGDRQGWETSRLCLC